MILLQPVTSSQTIKIVPRSYKADSNVQVIITEDGTRKTHTLNTSEYTEHSADAAGQKYITI